MKFSQMLKQKIEEIQKSKKDNDYEAHLQDNDDLIALNKEVINQKERIQNYEDDILSSFENKEEEDEVTKKKEKPKEPKKKEERVYQNMKQYKSDLLIQSQKQKEKQELEQIIQSSSIDEVKDIWSYLKSFGEKQVDSQVLTNQIPKYKPTQQDFSNVYYGELLKKIYGKDWKQKECHQEVSDEFKVHTATQYFQDDDTGERYLMQYQVQYFQHEKHSNKNASILTIAFLFFDQEQKQFQLKSQFLLDAYDQYKMNKQSMYNFVLNRGSLQYFFMKKRTRLNDRWFQTLELFQQKVRCSSKFDFLGEPAGNDELQIQQLDQLTIVLPVDCQMRLEELEYSFLTDAKFGQNKKNQIVDKNFINNQFVLIRSTFNTHYDLNEEERVERLKKNEILIYSLNETSKPILRFEEIEFESILLGFYTQIDEKTFVFSLKGQSKNYQIKFNQDDYFIYKQYSKQSQQDLLEKNNLKIENIKRPYYRAFLQQLEPLHITINKYQIDKNEKKYKQSYFISDDGDIELIYPLQSQVHNEKFKLDNIDSLTNYQIALQLINEKHKIATGGYIQLCTLYFDYQIDYAVRNEQMIEFLDSIQPIPSSKYMSICCTKDTVVVSNYYGCVNIYLINDCQEQGYFENYRLESEHTMLQNILDNFDWKKQAQVKQLKNNYDYLDDNHVSNEFLESFYVNKRKQGVISTHNKVWVNSNLFEFEKNKLIIDLSQNSQEKEPFYLLDLFQEDIKDVQLVKYHTTNLSAIFFFLQRNKFWINEEGKKVQNTELSGVHFFVIMPIQQLKLLKLENKPVLEKGCVVYIPINIDNIKKVNYEWQEMLTYQDNSKKVSFTHTHLDFEMVRDLGDPTNDWFPFVYYNWVNQNRYNQYFCFMNVEKLGYKLHYQELQDQDVKIDFSENILIFKINYFKNETEPKDLKDCQGKNIYRLNVLQSQNRNSNKISRCSNWQKNIQNKSKNLKSLQYSARFQIGSNVNFSSISTVEIKEFLITIDKSENYFNQDQLFFYNSYQQDLSQELKPENNSYINFTPIQQIFCIKSQQFMQNQISSCENITPYENERILPNMDDNGNISGSYLLLNNIQNLFGTYNLTNDLQVIKNLHAPQIFTQIESKLGQVIFITKKEDSTFDGVFQDGTEIQKIKYEATIEFIEYKKSVKLDSTSKYLQAFNKMRKPTYVYQLLEVDDVINKQTHLIKGPITTMKLKTFSFYQQPFNQIFLCSTMFNKDIIQSNYFDKSESTFWLYHFSRILICMSQPNFEEAFNISNENKLTRYFQPRFILNGNSICYLDFDFYGFSINNLKHAFEIKLASSHKYQFLENSSIYYAAISNENQCHKNMDNFVNSFYVNKFHYLQYDSLRFVSVIEQSISANKMKAATYIVEYMLQNGDQNFFIKALTTDLPQILCSQKININEFLHINSNEDTLIALEQNHLAKNKNYESKLTIVNLEQYLIDPSLPTFGSDEIHTFFIKNFNSSFWTGEEIIQFIDQQDQKEQKKNDHSGNLVSIEYTMLNFQPMIRKLKIDKILGQKGSIDQHTEYRDLVKGQPQDIKYIDDLFLSSILFKNLENSKFFLNSTIDNLIQNQFEKVRPIVKSFLYFYIIGFVIPFLTSTLIYDQIDSSQESQWELYFKYSLYVIAAVTQIIFAIFEYADIRINGILSYVSNGFNLMDSSQFVLYSINIYIRLYGIDLNQNMMHLLFDKILQILILLQSTSRILQYIRFNDDLSFLVQMIIRVLIDLLPFLTIFLLYILVFSFIIIILGGDFDPEGYSLMPKYLRIGIQIFRNAIGDIAVIDYGIWKEDEDKQGFSQAQPIAVFLIWAIWLLYIFFMLIVMLNFIIAEVGDTYNTVKEQGDSLLNRQKLELNNLVFQIQDLFGLKNQYRCIVYQAPHQNINVDEVSFSDQINVNTNKSLAKMKRELVQVIEKLKEENLKETQNILKAIQKPALEAGQEGQDNQVEEDGQQPVSLLEVQKKQDKLIDLVSAYNEKVDQQTSLISKLVDQDVGNMEIMMQMMNTFQNQNQ